MADAIQTKQIKQNSIKQKTHRTKQQQILQHQEIVEESITATNTTANRRSTQGEQVMGDESVQEITVNQPESLKQLPTTSPVERLEVSVDQSTVLLASDHPETAVVNVSLFPQKSIITQETHVSEHEERSELSAKRQEQRVSISSTNRINQSITVTEVDTAEELSILGQSEPNLHKPRSSALLDQSLPIAVSQPEISDNVDIIKHTETTKSQAQVVYNLHDSKVVSEAFVAQSEITINRLQLLGSETATESTSSVDAIQMSEVQTQEVGEEFNALPDINDSAMARIRLQESQPIEITEIITENTSDKYYPELVVATEVATKTVVEQTPFMRHELYINENEQTLEADVSPPHQNANISFKTNETISVTEATAEESEHSLDVLRRPSTVTATDDFTTVQGVSAHVVQAQSPTDVLDTPLFTRVKATVEIDEHISLVSNETQFGESEIPLLVSTHTIGNQANCNFSFLESSKASQTFVIEQESKLDDFNTPRSSHAEPSVKSLESVSIADTYTFDSSKPFEQVKTCHKAEAVLSFELQESKQISLITSNDMESDLTSKPIEKSVAANIMFNEQQSVQVIAQESVEQERTLSNKNTDCVQHAKNVLGQSLILAETEEVHPSTIASDIETSPKTHLNAHVHQDTQEITVIRESIAFEAIREFDSEDTPDHQIAACELNQQRSIQVTEYQHSERGENLILPAATIKTSALPVHEEPSRSVVVHEVAPILSIEAVTDLVMPLTKATVANKTNDETIVLETTALEAVRDMQLSKPPESIHALVGVDVCRSVQIEEAETSEKEGTFTSVKSLEYNIQPHIPTEIQKSIITETTQISQETSLIPDKPKKLLNAHLVSGLHEQKIIMENVPLEATLDLIQTKVDDKEHATSVHNIQKSIQVSIHETVEHEGSFSIPKQSTFEASSRVPDIICKSIVVEEVNLTQGTVDVSESANTLAAASITSSPFEASMVTDVTSYEETELIALSSSHTEHKPTTKFDELYCAEVSEQAPAETERNRPADKPIEIQTAFVLPTHSLKSVGVEEIHSCINTGDVQKPEISQQNAFLINTEWQSTAVTEVLALEEITQLRENVKPKSELAKTTQNSFTYLQIEQSDISEKEDIFKSNEPVLSYGTPVPSASFKSVTVEQPEFSMVPADFQTGPLSTNVHNASASLDEQEQTVLSEVYVCDDISELEAFKTPQVLTATTLIDTLTSAQVSHYETSDKEQILNAKSPADTHTASLNISDNLKSVVVEDIQSYASTYDESPAQKVVVNAKISSEPLNETTISETVPLENVEAIQSKQLTTMETRIASSTTDHHQSVTVLQRDVSEIESPLQLLPLEFENAKQSAPHIYHSIHVNESVLTDCTTKIELDILPMERANVYSNISKETNVIEIVALEDIGKEFEFKTPAAKLGQPTIESHTALIVESHLLPEPDLDNLSIENRTITTADLLLGHSLTSAVVEEVQEQGSTTDVLNVRDQSTLVTVKHAEQDSVITAETTIFEIVDKRIKPTAVIGQIASAVIDENNSVVVSNNETIISVEEFESFEKLPIQQVTPINTHSLKVVSVAESKIFSTLGDHITLLPVERANRRQLEHHDQTKSTETTVYETTKPYDQITPKETQRAEQDLNTNIEVITSIVDIFCNEQELEIASSNRQSCTPSISKADRQSIVTEEVIPIEKSDDFNQPQPQVDHSKIVQTLQKQITTTMITDYELTLGLTDSTVQSATATKTIIPHHTTEQNVVQSIDTVDDLELQGQRQKQAIAQVDTLSTTVKTITDIEENIYNIVDSKPQQNVASIQQIPSNALLVNTVISESKEIDLVTPTIKKEQAQSAFEELIVAQKSGVVANDTAVSFEEYKTSTKNASLHLKPQTSQAQYSVNDLIAPINLEIIAEDSTMPFEKTLQTREQFIETTYTTSNRIAETYETTTNETAKTIPSHDNADSMLSATLVFDSNKSSIVEEVSTNESAIALETTLPSNQSFPEVKQPDALHTVQVTEIQTTELTEDMEETMEKRVDKARLIESEIHAIARMEKQSMIQGR